MKKIMTIFVFIFVCICGLFTAWIGGIAPFTPTAAMYSFITLMFALYLSFIYTAIN